MAFRNTFLRFYDSTPIFHCAKLKIFVKENIFHDFPVYLNLLAFLHIFEDFETIFQVAETCTLKFESEDFEIGVSESIRLSRLQFVMVDFYRR